MLRANRILLATLQTGTVAARATSDPFVEATRQFVEHVPDLVAAVYPDGGHTAEFWAATAPGQLASLAQAPA